MEISRITHSPSGRARPINLARDGCCSSGMRVQVIEELKAKADISRGALFRRVLKNGKMTTTRLSPEAIREIVKKRSQGIRGVKGRVSGHSLRVGSAVSLARGNASLVEMQVDGRWKDSRMPSHYASAELAKNSATARIKYGKRR